MPWPTALAATLALIVVLASVLGWLSSRHFDEHVTELKRQLGKAQAASRPATPNLPEIVRAYAVRAGGRVGGPPVIRCRQRALLTVTRGRPPVSIAAEQWTGTREPGIVWSATGRMSGLPVRVLDAFVGGYGELRARLLGLVQVAGGAGPDYDKGELMRYLSELPLHPDAILNAGSLRWRAIDARTVDVSARSATGTASVRFIFDAAGDIVRMEADDRPMSVGGRTVPTPWHGAFSDYRQFGHYRIPAHGEVGWVLPDGLFTYWRGELLACEPVAEAASPSPRRSRQETFQ